MEDKAFIVYSSNGEDFNDTEVNDVIQTLVNHHMGEDEWFVGAKLSYHKAKAIKSIPSDFVLVDHILEDIQCQADDVGGEYAEMFTYCDKEAQEELNRIVGDWADKHLTCNFYRVINSEEVFFTVDQQMYEDFK